MKLNVKIFLLLTFGILTISVFFVLSSVRLLARHQESNFQLFRTELLSAGAEQIRYAADLFFNNLDTEIQRTPDVTIHSLVAQLYPPEGFVTLIGADGVPFDSHTTLLAAGEAVAAIQNARLNRAYRFTRSNFPEFLNDRNFTILPTVIYYKVYVQQDCWYLVGYGKIFRTMTDRLRYVAKQKEESLVMFILVSAGIVTGGITALLLFQIGITRRLIFLPLRRLQGVFQDIASGRLERRISVIRVDEIGALETSFNEMADQLQKEIVTRQEAETNLKRLTDHLEEEVSRKTQDLREAMIAAEAASEAKGRFLANVSHELRTPLNAIMGFTSLLRKTPLDSEQRQFIQTINHSSQVLLDLIHNILDHTKIEAGKISMEHISFHFEDMIENIVEIMGSNAKSKNIDLLYYYAPELSKKFFGDPTRIRQIIMNLLSNAIKFTHRGAVLIHVTQHPASDPSDTKTHLHIRVRDTGIGVPPEKQKGIFQSFIQGDDSTTRKYGGTGLGLSITKGLLDAMNGTISLRSRPGRGSTFSVHLSLDPDHDPSAHVDTHTLFKQRTVTLIDPGHLFVCTMERVLRNYGLTIRPSPHSSLCSCEKARHFLLQPGAEVPDIVLLNPFMPDGSGTALLSACRELPAYAKTTFIALSSSSDVQSEEIRCQAHYDGYLNKPVIGRNLRFILMRDVAPLSWATTANDTNAADVFTLKGLRILVAEDDLTSQALMKIMLEKAGCEVTVAETGKQAIEAMRIQAYDLVLMDIMMPEMGGMEAAAYIRKHLDQTTPIIALTAATLDPQKLTDAGMNDGLFKPVQEEQVESMLRKWIMPSAAESIPM